MSVLYIYRMAKKVTHFRIIFILKPINEVRFLIKFEFERNTRILSVGIKCEMAYIVSGGALNYSVTRVT